MVNGCCRLYDRKRKESELELLEEFIENGLVQDEIPFELIAKEYPKLLDDWYPGYPGYPRMATKDDPFCVDGKIEGEFLILYDIPGIDKLPISLDVEKEFGAGDCRVWLKKDGASWVATLQRSCISV